MFFIKRPVFHALLACIFICTVTASAVVVNVAKGFHGTAQFPADCGIVFGAAVHGADDPGPGIYRRVETAADLYSAGDLRRLILTGGKGSSSQESEAAVMQRLAVQFGVRSEDIVIEDRATSTVENIRYAMPLTEDCDSVVGISDRYHLTRIAYLADRMGFGVLETYPAERIANRAFETKSILREAAALLYTAIFGRDAFDFPENQES